MTPPATLEQAIAKIDALTRDNQILLEELRAWRMGFFGKRSERLEPGQLSLIEQGAQEVPIIEEPSIPAAQQQQQRKKGHGRRLFSDDLPREVIELDVPEAERACPDCGEPMRAFGEEVTERGHFVPARIIVRRYVKKRYACPDGHAVKTALAPDGVIDKGKYEASVYAHVATSKYADHLPLHRLEGIFKRHGMHLPKQSMWDMLVKVDELVAQPVLAQMRTELHAEPALHSDETPVTMRLEGGKGTSTGYAWSWRSLLEVETPKALVHFEKSRARDGPLQFLGEWSGTLIIDGYPGYDEVIRRNGIVRAGCMAHARRKVKEALDTGSKCAVKLLRPIQRLFWIERAVRRRAEEKHLDRDELIELRREVRARYSVVVWKRIQRVARDLKDQRSTLPKSKLGKAIGYIENQADALSAFLTDGRIPIHNNDAERDLRHVAIGRKNWLVFGSPRGGDVACRLYSLVLSCKQNDVDPEAYIADVLMKVATTPASQIASLTPWGWKAARVSRPPA